MVVDVFEVVSGGCRWLYIFFEVIVDGCRSFHVLVTTRPVTAGLGNSGVIARGWLRPV